MRNLHVATRSSLATALVWLLAILVLYPVLILVLSAFKTSTELVSNPLGLPQGWTLDNFDRAWNAGRMGQLLVNSLIVSSAVVVLTVSLSSLAGFAFARMRFRGRRALPLVLTIALVLPFEVLMVPMFYTFKGLGLLDTYAAMIVPQVALGLPFGILLMRAFMVDLPNELFDAAEIDGAGAWDQFRRLAVPLALPAAVALAVFLFIWSWNQYLIGLVMVQSSDMRTLPLGLSFFVGRFEANYGALAAAALIALLPSLAIYGLLHRHLLKVNLAGALK